MGKSVGRKVIDVFARTQDDVRYRLKRATDYKDFTIKKIKKVGKDSIGNNKYCVTLHKKREK